MTDDLYPGLMIHVPNTGQLHHPMEARQWADLIEWCQEEDLGPDEVLEMMQSGSADAEVVEALGEELEALRGKHADAVALIALAYGFIGPQGYQGWMKDAARILAEKQDAEIEERERDSVKS